MSNEIDTTGPYEITLTPDFQRPLIRLTRHNVLKYLRDMGPKDITEIRFGLNVKQGTVFSSARVRAVLVLLEEDGLVKRKDDKWIPT